MANRIGIAFGDNDFASTFLPFLSLLSGHLRVHELTKSDIVKLVERSIVGVFYLCQEMDLESTWDPLDTLRITEDQVLFDDEVGAKLMDGGNNRDFFVLDMSSPRGPYVYSA